jgi:hypothetical protein
MSYNGSGTFQINTSGQPVVAGTVISSTAFNALTADLATGLSTAITKDGQTTTTARIPFAAGINSSLTTDSSSTSTGSIITAGGVGIAKNLYVGVNANIAGTLSVTGSTTLTNPVINNIKMGYSTTATAAGTTTLTVSSNYRQFFTGTLAQTIVLPVTSTLVTGMAFEIENNSTGLLTVNSSGGNLVGTVPAGVCAHAVCIGTTLTTAADWDWDYISTTTITGTGANVLGTSPTITTPTIDTITSAAATALTLQSAGTTAITVSTSQNVGIGTTVNNVFDQSGAARALVVQKSDTSTTVGGSVASITIVNGDTTTNNIAQLNFAAITGASTTQYSPGVIGCIFGARTNGQYPTGQLTFSTSATGNAAPTERMRILSTGNILSLSGGSTTATGTGIAFPATVSLSSDANTLDDYEEGTWTPSLGGTTTYTARSGYYTKIGNTVRVYLEITVNLIGTGSTTTVSGFPFSPTYNDAGCVSYFDTLNANVYWLTIQMQSGGNCVFAGTTAATATIVNGVSIFKNGSRIIGTAVYQTSS